MVRPTKKFTFQKQENQYHEHCCVLECTASSTYSAGLSFHAFPSDKVLRRGWLVLIRREQFFVTSHSKVCSRHFLPGDVSEKLRRWEETFEEGSCPNVVQMEQL